MDFADDACQCPQCHTAAAFTTSPRAASPATMLAAAAAPLTARPEVRSG